MEKVLAICIIVCLAVPVFADPYKVPPVDLLSMSGMAFGGGMGYTENQYIISVPNTHISAWVTAEDIDWSGATQTDISMGTITIQTCDYTWQPKPDITTYELALCTTVLNNKNWVNTDFREVSDLPKNAQRHFKEDCR